MYGNAFIFNGVSITHCCNWRTASRSNQFPPTFDEELEKAAEAEFDKLFPNADTDMDVHAAQLKARHVVFILLH